MDKLALPVVPLPLPPSLFTGEERLHFQREGTESFSVPLWAQNDSLKNLIALLLPPILASTVLVGRRATSLGSDGGPCSLPLKMEPFLTWESHVLPREECIHGFVKAFLPCHPWLQVVLSKSEGAPFWHQKGMASSKPTGYDPKVSAMLAQVQAPYMRPSLRGNIT